MLGGALPGQAGRLARLTLTTRAGAARSKLGMSSGLRSGAGTAVLAAFPETDKCYLCATCSSHGGKGQRHHSDKMDLQRQPQTPRHAVRGAHDGPHGEGTQMERSWSGVEREEAEGGHVGQRHLSAHRAAHT